MAERAAYVGDIGGTHVRFATVARDAPTTANGFAKRPGAEFPTLEAAVAADLAARERPWPDAAIFAVAGPASGPRVALTNRNWTVDAETLKSRFGFRTVRVVNDFAAMARGVVALPASSFEVLFAGAPDASAAILVAGPGTGFGMATLLPAAAGWRVIAGEGGHIGYAPRTPFERAVVRELVGDEEGLVTAEEVAAGAGFARLVHAAHLAFGAAGPAPAPESVHAAADDPFAAALCRFRAHAVMRACADAALVVDARGGLVLAGGVAEALAAWLATPEAIAEFHLRGPGGRHLAGTPVRLLRDPLAPLVGAAALAFDQWTD